MAWEDHPADESGRHTGARAILTVEERVTHIVGMMERFEWVRGKSAPALAAEWGLAVSTVEHSAAEASRRCTGDADEARRDITLGARRLLKSAIESDDKQGFKQVAEVWAMVSGAKAPEKHQVGPLDGATPGKAREVMAELFGGVTPEKKPDADPQR
jgi:hypothetical protein